MTPSPSTTPPHTPPPLFQNAALCAEDLFFACSSQLSLGETEVELLCSALLDSRATNVPRPIRSAAAAALDQAVATQQLLRLTVPALAAKANHKNRDVAEQVTLASFSWLQCNTFFFLSSFLLLVFVFFVFFNF